MNTEITPRDAHGSRRVLLVESSPELADELQEAIRRGGHEVVLVTDGEDALERLDADVVVADQVLSGAYTGLELVAELQGRGQRVPTVVIGGRPNWDDCRCAFRLGVVDFLAKPVNPTELLAAIDRATDRSDGVAREPRAAETFSHEQVYTTGEGVTERAARELAAFLLGRGVGPSHRMRAVSAAAEILHNASRHAYPAKTGGMIRISAFLVATSLTVEIQDRGEGIGLVRPSVGGGLARARSLSEGLEVRTGGGGTCVKLTFQLHSPRFEEEEDDLSEADFLDPERTRELLTELRRQDDHAPVVLPQPMAATVGRLLSEFGRPRTTRVA